MTGEYERGHVVRGPDLFGPHRHRPFVRLSDDTHPFEAEEALLAAVTSTPRPRAIRLWDDDFVCGSLPRESYVNPWTIATVKHADLAGVEGRLTSRTTDRIAEATAGYLGVS